MKYGVFSGVLPELSAEDVCARLARHGYDGVEWRVNGEYHWRAATIDQDAPLIAALCAAHGLGVAGLTTYVRPDEEDAVRRSIEACQILGCPRFRIFSAIYDPAVGYFPLRDQMRAKLERLGRQLEDSGVKALLEIHFGTHLLESRARLRVATGPRPGDHRRDPRSGQSDDRGQHGPAHGARHDRTVRRPRARQEHPLGADRCGPMALAVRRARRGHVRLGRGRAGPAEGWLRRLAVVREPRRVPVRHRGYVAEDLADASLPPRDIDQRLADELAYLRRLMGGSG